MELSLGQPQLIVTGEVQWGGQGKDEAAMREQSPGCAEEVVVGGRRWGLRCQCHLADTKQFICPCGIKPREEEKTSHAQEREEQG